MGDNVGKTYVIMGIYGGSKFNIVPSRREIVD